MSASRKLPWLGPVRQLDGVDVYEWAGHTTLFGGPVLGTIKAIAYLEFLNSKAEAIGCHVSIIQSAWNTGVPQSAGTHDKDRTYDLQIVGLSWDDGERFVRKWGMAGWHRTPAQGFTDHLHAIILGMSTPVGTLIPSQLWAYDNKRDGLGPSPFGADNTFHPDPQFVFDYAEFLKDQDMQLSDTFDGKTTVRELFRKLNRLADNGIPALREHLAELDKEINALPTEASVDQIKSVVFRRTAKIREDIDALAAATTTS